ncbi:GNAT family N-acetyltransferase [Bacillus velezensis]|uniref:GNAT family N-acetyltransferase n=1 Tax=Bacillus velezensis TaxID=492670 RepID=UPI002DBBBF78|nr:GNAT family N-acetyltransferase [Bacillus velezensis]MEC1338523.1 GNAT family N-acetyltransferase [Bacillus velezensis]
MYRLRENLAQDMIHAFLHQKGIQPEAYESSLCLLEENSLQGVILYENSSWESQLFRKNIINVKLAAANSTGQLKRLFQAFYAARRAAGTDFIFIKIPAEDIGAMQVVQQLPNAYFVGSLLKLVSPVRVYNSTPPFEITEAGPGDTEAIRRLARDAFTKSRYYQDPHLSYESANRLFEEWARNNAEGRASLQFAATYKGETVGFVQGLSKGDEFVLDLMAVKPGFEGKGAGFHLAAHVIEQSLRFQHKTVSAGTQLHNVRAIRLYERMGFKVDASYYYYHVWPGKEAD